MWLLLLLPASAQVSAATVDGDTVLQPCLSDTACNDWLTRLLSQTMGDYGFVYQHIPNSVSAISGKGMGAVTEIRLDSTPLQGPNEVTDGVPLPPAIPRFSLGYQVGSYTYDSPYPQYAVFVTGAPPIPLSGNSAWAIGGGASAAVPLDRRSVFWLGVEADVDYAEVRATMVGDGRLGPLSSLPTNDDIAPTCSGNECKDQVTQLAGGARAGLAFDPAPLVYTFAKVGGAYVADRFKIDVDDSVWSLTGLVPQFSLGGGVRAFDKVQVGLSWDAYLRDERWTADDRGPITSKWVFSLSMRHGDERYWEQGDPQPDSPPTLE